MDATGHESETALELYALGRLPEPDTARIEEHLLWCAACREQLEPAAEFACAMRDELQAHPLPAKQSIFEWFSLPRPALAFAGVFAMVLLALALYWVRPAVSLAPMASLQLTAMRGETQNISTARELHLTVTDAPDKGGPFRLELVDGSGGAVWKGTPTATPRGLDATIPNRLSPGDYFVRLYGTGGELLHEYGFRVHG